ncbi:MAG TPA: bacteriohopanetetrol glucosamine biosynthesis glycosyltransferase HpnI [Candidatus Methylacidiphilales bacterium]|jgi:ceramide glucosyltransferase|nr:bacteriohopanetetrol glucosamine biosynthesis glycosyltransferase HpnI [Candidatus Methylacidiphilales bacterium]
MAHPILFALAAASGAAALLGIFYTMAAIPLVGRFFSRPLPEPAGFPPVTVLKPLHGGEWALTGNLSSFCQQDYPGPVQHLFGVNDAEDVALKSVDELRRRYPDANITVVADSRLHGPNRKVSNLINMMPRVEHDVLVFSDSDVGVGPAYLRGIVGELQRPGVALVTCIYRGEPDPGLWPRLSAIATNYQFLPGVVVGIALGRARPCFGQTIAMRRETLQKIGGIGQFVGHLAEDHAIGEAVRATGGEVTVPPFTVSHACAETTLGKLVSHELRWSRTIRAVDAAGHLGSALVHPFAFAILAVLLSSGAGWSCALAGAALVSRLALMLRVDRVLHHARRDLYLLPLWDLAALAIFAASFCSTRVKWRGFNFSVDGKGMISPIQEK